MQTNLLILLTIILLLGSPSTLDMVEVSGRQLTDSKAVSAAKQLKHDFLKLLETICQSLSGADVGNLKLRINWFLLNSESKITPSVQEHLDKLQSVSTPDGVLKFLISRNFLSYLKYELFEAFPKEDKLKFAIREYEEKHKAFLSSISFNTLVEVFKHNPELAPASPIGLPEFKIHLEGHWGNRSIYDWKTFLDKEFLSSWPSHLMIEGISEDCTVLTYAVLPIYVSAVAKDLTNHQVLENLEKQGITVTLTGDCRQSNNLLYS